MKRISGKPAACPRKPAHAIHQDVEMHDFSAEGDRSEVDNELRRKNIVLDAINRVF